MQAYINHDGGKSVVVSVVGCKLRGDGVVSCYMQTGGCQTATCTLYIHESTTIIVSMLLVCITYNQVHLTCESKTFSEPQPLYT